MYLSSPCFLPPLFFFFFFLFTASLSSSPTPLPPHQHHFIKSIPPQHSRRHHLSQYLELTHPLPSDHLTPSCSFNALYHHFGNTMGQPPVSVPYSPPFACSWSQVALELQTSCKGEQYDRIAGVWLAGAELFRTSTAEPTPDGVFWKVRKDVTRYSSLLAQSDLTLTVMLENVINKVFTGVYHVNLTFFYYQTSGDRDHSPGRAVVTDDQRDDKLKLKHPISLYTEGIARRYDQKIPLKVYDPPADLIIPISGGGDGGFWFRIQSEEDVQFKGIKIPTNTYKAVLEVYVSFHGDDEFWYSNPPDSYIALNNLTTGRGHGAYREVFVMIDGNYAGSVIPFPVVFTGGINPLMWEPVVAIGAFDLPSYDFDLTPVLGLVLDGKSHVLGLGVSDSIPFWLVDANLHLWLNVRSEEVRAETVEYHTPTLSIKRLMVFNVLDGAFRIEARRRNRFVGWVKSDAGNLTTHVVQEFKFKNVVRFHNNGTYKQVKQRVKTKTQVMVKSDMGKLISRSIVRTRYPLNIGTATLESSKRGTYVMMTNVSHRFMEKSTTTGSLELEESTTNGGIKRSLTNKQDSIGWMKVKDHSVLSGTANTNQTYNYRSELGCYSRNVAVFDGKLSSDNSSFACASAF